MNVIARYGRARSARALMLIALWAALDGAAAPAAATQVGVPGMNRRGRMSERDRYYALVTQGLHLTTSDWREAWDRSDGDAAARLYVEDAELRLPDGSRAVGRDAVGALLADAPKRLGTVELRLERIDASGRMAAASGALTFRHRSPDGRTRVVSGYHLTVFVQENGDVWRIRFQVLVVPPAPDDPP